MNSEHKKAFFLLQLVVFSNHGLDEDELMILKDNAKLLKAEKELAWSMHFFAQQQETDFSKIIQFVNEQFLKFDKGERLSYLGRIWQANKQKGYTTEMEATTILQFAKSWGIEPEMLDLIKRLAAVSS